MSRNTDGTPLHEASRLTANWPDVVHAMRLRAEATESVWLGRLAEMVEVGVGEHWYGWSDGCVVCHGRDMIACPEWHHVQGIALGWLLRQSGLV
jgi:hypothetical protein